MKAKSSRMSQASRRWLTVGLLAVVFLSCANDQVCAHERKATPFEAIGLTEPVKLDPVEFGERKKASVEVYFDLLPTSMRFYLPSFPCMVTENNIQYSNFWAETYEPRIGGGSFETLMDRNYRYARMWIQSQNDARIIVRVRGALCDRRGNIAHTDVPSGSPYGKGDWVDEWFYIYPDGVHVRHVKIYTGLASRSRPFGFDREPPNVVHEFMEAAVVGAKGHTPLDDIEIGALTLIKMIGGHSEHVIPGGASKTINFKPYPDDFGDFRDASIMVVNTKSKYRPFTIGLPYGVRIQPYQPEDDLPYVFQTWGNPTERGYATAFGHILNFWHYRRTDNTLEQVYLQGLTDEKDPAKELVPLAWSWIAGPKLRMEGLKLDYKTFTYDQSQKAYVLSCKDGQLSIRQSSSKVGARLRLPWRLMVSLSSAARSFGSDTKRLKTVPT
ncbi:MAG: hypothetical protein ACYSWR_01075 [Planctomycetota bacterium]|jgi:hypothetical protein